MIHNKSKGKNKFWYLQILPDVFLYVGQYFFEFLFLIKNNVMYYDYLITAFVVIAFPFETALIT